LFSLAILYFTYLTIVLKSGPAWRVDSRLKPGRVEKKQGKKKPGVTRQDPVKNPVATH